jgi:hypothetical protein
MKSWLGVAQLSHVQRGLAGGFVQTNKGARSGIARMAPGDGIAFYSPKTDFPEGDRLQQFTGIGRICDEELWEAEMGEFRAWRRRAEFALEAHPTPIAPLLDLLDLTRGRQNWGILLHRGQLEISQHDFELIAAEMGAATLVS